VLFLNGFTPAAIRLTSARKCFKKSLRVIIFLSSLQFFGFRKKQWHTHWRIKRHSGAACDEEKESQTKTKNSSPRQVLPERVAGGMKDRFSKVESWYRNAALSMYKKMVAIGCSLEDSARSPFKWLPCFFSGSFRDLLCLYNIYFRHVRMNMPLFEVSETENTYTCRRSSPKLISSVAVSFQKRAADQETGWSDRSVRTLNQASHRKKRRIQLGDTTLDSTKYERGGLGLTLLSRTDRATKVHGISDN
jgi:hypothetical protein